MKRGSLAYKVGYRISRSKDNVFVLDDFTDLADANQVGRALRSLIREGRIVKIGYGLYAKAHYNRFIGKIAPAQPLPWLAKEALAKLNVRTGSPKFERLYNEGISTQVPTGSVIGVKDRVSRKIGFDNWEISFERVPQ